MSGQAILTAMLPEHLLLAGIVLLHRARDRAAAAAARSRCRCSSVARRGRVRGLAARHRLRRGAVRRAVLGRAADRSLAKAIVLALAVPVLLISRDDFADDGPFYPLLLSSLYGFCLLLSADSFLTLFLGLEIMSIPVYVLVLLAFRRPESAEAALKYLVLGGTATAMFLMGVSLLYGGSGLAGAVGASPPRSARPTRWRPPPSCWCSSRSSSRPRSCRSTPGRRMPTKARASRSRPTWPRSSRRACCSPRCGCSARRRCRRSIVDLLAILPLVSIVWGNLTAMRQTSFRRMIAYSSIAHAGYLFYAFLGDGPGPLPGGRLLPARLRR